MELPPELMKKRRVKGGNGAPPKRRRTLGARKPAVVTISARDRARQFTEQPFQVMDNKLICAACKMASIDLKKDTILNHIKSKKHISLHTLRRKETKKQLMISAEYFQREQICRGITPNISLDLTANRIRVISALLSDGIPLNVLSREQGGVRELLKELLGSLPR